MDRVDPLYLRMLLAYEDKRFRDHAGVDPRSVLRAASVFGEEFSEAALAVVLGAPGVPLRLRLAGLVQQEFLTRELRPEGVVFRFRHALVREDRLADARQAFLRATVLEPAVAQHAFNLAVALDRLHDYANARHYYDRALSLSAQAGGERASGVPHAVVQSRLEQLQAAAR